MARYLDPKADLTFKKVFGEHKELLISLLNALLPLKEGQEIVSIEYMSPELFPDTPYKKDSIVDVRCVDADNRDFLVEMQMFWTSAFKHRALFNTAKAVSSQLEAGAPYRELRPVYTLSLVNDIAFPDTERFYHHYLPTDQSDSKKVIEGFNMIFVELPKFAKWQAQHGSDASQAPAGVVEISSQTFKRLAVLWCRFLTEINEHTFVVDDTLLADDNVRKAIDLVRGSAFTDAERLAYDRYWDMVSRERTALEEAELRGRIFGEAKGRAEGEAKGRAEGEAKGRAEAVLATARKLKALGIPSETIAQATGLTLAEIEAL